MKASDLNFENNLENRIAKMILDTIFVDNGDSYILSEMPERLLKGGLLIIYDETKNINTGVECKGLERLFKLDGLIGVLNDYFLLNRIDLRAVRFELRGIDFIKIEKFVRLSTISKVERKEDVGRNIIDQNDERYKDIFKEKSGLDD